MLHSERDPGKQPAAAGSHDDGPHVGALVENLDTHGGLARHHVRMVERMDQHRPGLGGERPRGKQGVVDGGTGEADVRSVGLGGALLHDGRALRHEYGGLRVEHARRQGHSLGVVARTRRDHAVPALLGGEPGDTHVRTANLERTGTLQVLALQVDRPAHFAAQPPRVFERRRPDNVLQQLGSGLYLRHRQVHRHRSCHSGRPRAFQAR
jgi:hypothetical protein